MLQVDRFWAIGPSARIHLPTAIAGTGAPGRLVPLRLGRCSLGDLPPEPSIIHLPEPLTAPRGAPLVTATHRDGSAVVLAARRGDGDVELAFHPDRAVRALAAEASPVGRRPAAARLPFNYRRVPRVVRTALRDLMARRRADALEDFPAWPVEPSVEILRRIYLLARRALEPGLEPAPFWPERRRFALVLTHDVDSAEGLALAPELAREEQERGLSSCWFLVGRDYELAEEAIGSLRDAGGELALHDVHHDNRGAFLAPAAIARRLDSVRQEVERFGMRGFRSPSMLVSEPLYDALEERFAWDSSVADSALLPVRGGGGTVFPSERGRLTVLPLTLPADGQLVGRGMPPERVLAAWIAKAEWVRSVGGTAMILTHPERGFTADAGMRAAHRSFLDWAAGQADAWRVLPTQLADHWRARAAGAAAGPSLAQHSS